MEKIADFISNNIYFVSAINIISIIGFAITISVALGVRLIKRSYLFRARVPEHLVKLIDFSTELTGVYKNFDSKENNGALSLIRIKCELSFIKNKVGKNFNKKEINMIIKEINNYMKDSYHLNKTG
ncbi:MAG: hypothetical protein JEZ00_16460 [Anaerolineaceae bacterium]|nr:hypothetical protein [Anaerolineaceae bacterium]